MLLSGKEKIPFLSGQVEVLKQLSGRERSVKSHLAGVYCLVYVQQHRWIQAVDI